MEGETEFILQCNHNSFIEQVMYSKAALETSSLLNHPLLFCLTPDSLEAGKRFLEDIRWEGKAEDYDLEIQLNGEKCRFLFSGVQLRNHLIIVAQHTPVLPEETTETITEELVAEELEHSFEAENNAPEIAEDEENPEVTVWNLMEELSRLNNELINTKRELIRKNMELERLQKLFKNK
jgi:hypothetical protein